MSLISENLKYLRKRDKLTQEELANQLQIKRSLVGAYEEGRADPRIENLKRISEVFGLPVDDLIGTNLSKLTDVEFEKLKMKPGESKFQVLAITVDKEERENIHLVPQKAAAGYLNGYADPEYIQDLPKFQLPMLPQNGSYRAFEITGDSMLPVEPGSVIIGQYMENLDEVKNGFTYILVTSKEGIVFKRVFNYVEEKGKLFLVSDNKAYAPYEVEAEDVVEVWQAKAFISVKFPEPGDQETPNLQELTNIVMDLKEEITNLKAK